MVEVDVSCIGPPMPAQIHRSSFPLVISLPTFSLTVPLPPVGKGQAEHAAGAGGMVGLAAPMTKGAGCGVQDEIAD